MTPNIKKIAIPFYLHDLGTEELNMVRDVFNQPILTTGEFVSKFENIFSDYLGSKHVLALNSCSAALHLSLIALGIGHGDEVITTPMTFIATAAAIELAGAKPVFVDVEFETGNMNVDLIENAITKKTKAILPVHLYGHMCDMFAIQRLAKKHKLFVIEDCAHCVEGARDGIRPGDLSDVACFSFFATKNLTCGEGGALSTNNTQLYKKLKLLSLHGMNKTAADRYKDGYSHWDMTILGWKYNMDNIHAAILIPQMKRIDKKLIIRNQIALKYEELLSNIPNLRFQTTKANTIHSRHLFPIWINPRIRDNVLSCLQKNGLSIVVNYRSIHLLTHFKQSLKYKKNSFPVSKLLGDSEISLPLYPTMDKKNITYIVDILKDAIEKS